jgi:hypothetical protein
MRQHSGQAYSLRACLHLDVAVFCDEPDAAYLFDDHLRLHSLMPRKRAPAPHVRCGKGNARSKRVRTRLQDEYGVTAAVATLQRFLCSITRPEPVAESAAAYRSLDQNGLQEYSEAVLRWLQEEERPASRRISTRLQDEYGITAAVATMDRNPRSITRPSAVAEPAPASRSLDQTGLQDYTATVQRWLQEKEDAGHWRIRTRLEEEFGASAADGTMTRFLKNLRGPMENRPWRRVRCGISGPPCVTGDVCARLIEVQLIVIKTGGLEHAERRVRAS